MTTALAFDLFLDEHDVLLDNKLTDHINSEMKSWSKKTTNLTVVKNDNPENKMFFHKAKNDNPENKMLFDKAQDEKPEIKSLFYKANSNILENDNSEIEMYLDKARTENGVNVKFNTFEDEKNKNEIRREMIKGYMKLLS